MGDKQQFSSPSAYAGNRRGRKVASIVGGVCALAAGVIILMSYLVPSTGFVASIDYEKAAEQASLLRLRGSRSGKGPGGQGPEEGQLNGGDSTILHMEEVKNAYPIDAEGVLAQYEALKKSETGLDGAQAIAKEGHPSLGMFYTFYLSYESNDEKAPAALNYDFSLSYSNYITGSGGNTLLSYLRVLICVEHPGQAEEHYWFAMSSSTINAENDYREAVSVFTWNENHDERTASFKDGDIAYCQPFVISTEEKTLGRVPSLPIVKNAKETRFTVAVYLEGWDPDCVSYRTGESLAFNAQFTINPVETL